MIDAVLWDLGGVLCRFHPDRRLAAFEQLSGRSIARVEATVNAQLRVNLDLGRVTPGELLDRIRRGLDWDCDYATVVRAWSAAFSPDERVLAIARRVNVTNGLLSDNGPPIADNFAKCLPEVAAVIATPVFSSDIAATKPSPEAFSAACRTLSAEPTEVLFIDDNPANVASARDVGLTAVGYTTPEQLRDCLAGYGLLQSE